MPRWDCACEACALVRSSRARRRLHASLAVSADGEKWVVLGATPDVSRQLESFDALHPREGASHPVVAFVLRSAAPAEALGLALLSPSSSKEPLRIFVGPGVEGRLSVMPGRSLLTASSSFVPVSQGDDENGLEIAIVDIGHGTNAVLVRERDGRQLVWAPEMPEGADLPISAREAVCVFADAAAASRLGPKSKHRYLVNPPHGAPIVTDWTVADDGLVIFV